jgi:hypothetical protein
MPSTARALTAEQRVIAKRIAQSVIGAPAPKWSEIGLNKRERMYAQFLELLRESENDIIAEILEQDKEMAFEIFQGKIKTMRAKTRKNARHGSAATSMSTTA